jgi:peptide/nickel transport system permease protein
VRYFTRKIAFYVVAAWAAITVNFFLPRLIPGNPVEVLLTRQEGQGPVPPQEARSLELLLGLGQGNLLQRYVGYLDQLAHLQFGRSITYFPTPVTQVVAQALPWTIVLVGVASALAALVGITLGTLAGWKRSAWVDSLVPSTTFLTAIPYFWLALVLLYLFASVLHLLPLYGGYNPALSVGFSGPFLLSAVDHAILPAATIVISSVGGWMLGMRNMMVSTLAEDYVLAAEAKGISPRKVMLGYAARNAVLPSVTGFAISLGFVVSGQIVMEVVFSYPGIGYTLLQAVSNDDYPLMQAIFLVIALAVLGANLFVDLLYGFIDPRTRASR